MHKCDITDNALLVRKHALKGPFEKKKYITMPFFISWGNTRFSVILNVSGL